MGESGRRGGLQLTEDDHIGSRACRNRHLIRGVGADVAIALVAAAALARPTASLDGTWGGTVDMGAGRAAGTASGALAQSGKRVTGSLTLDATTASGVFAVSGTVRGLRVVVGGRVGARRLRWKARYDASAKTWRGRVVERGGGAKVRAMLTLAPDGGAGAPTCGAGYFASDVMPTVIDPICAQGHVPGGAAQAAPFKVVPGNATATARSAITEVDPLDPAHSKLIEKPTARLPHGGGQRIVPGSVEEQVLLHWIALVTVPGCDVGTGGGGGGGGGGGTGADLYAQNCASCHGADARGLDGRPDIRCARNIADPVRNGRAAPPPGPDGDMPAFTNLSDADIASIQAFLGGLCPVSAVTGVELFASNCSSCHGADATGTATAPGVRCATRVADAVRVGRGAAMPAFAAITDAEIALLDGYLTGLCDQSGRPAADLYAGNCSTCHGATAAGGTNALGVQGPDIHCSRGIAEPVTSGEGTNMPAFPGLGSADVSVMQQWLATTFCPIGSATGTDLYASNCATCHGADARGVGGTPDVRCNRSIHDAVVSGRTGASGTMPSFAMTDPEIALVQGFLVGLCPIGSATAEELFASNCATCHGAGAVGTPAGLEVRCATRAADAMQVGRGTRMPSFPEVVSSEVTSIQGYLTGLCDQLGRPGSSLYVGNCSTCHGPTAGGGQNGLGVHGPDVRCTGSSDFTEAIVFGSDAMPPFPALGAGDVTAITDYVHASFCSGG